MVEQTERSKELEGLFVDESEQAVDGLLRTTLEPFVGFTREGRVVTKPAFLELSHANRLLVMLLARQAAVRLSLPGATMEATAENLQQECMVPVKSCREYLSKMKAKRLLEKNAQGYLVPQWALPTVAGLLVRRS